MPKILSICADEGLRFTREALLLRTGAEVTSADFHTGLGLARQQRFDLLVIGHTLAEEEAIQLAEIFRYRWPGSRILHLGSVTSQQRSGNIPYDSGIDWTEGPDIFLRTARRLLRQAVRYTLAHPSIENVLDGRAISDSLEPQ